MRLTLWAKAENRATVIARLVAQGWVEGKEAHCVESPKKGLIVFVDEDA